MSYIQERERESDRRKTRSKHINHSPTHILAISETFKRQKKCMAPKFYSKRRTYILDCTCHDGLTSGGKYFHAKEGKRKGAKKRLLSM